MSQRFFLVDPKYGDHKCFAKGERLEPKISGFMKMLLTDYDSIIILLREDIRRFQGE